jgi:hypothetical protein
MQFGFVGRSSVESTLYLLRHAHAPESVLFFAEMGDERQVGEVGGILYLGHL